MTGTIFKLLLCLFAGTLVFGLAIPSIYPGRVDPFWFATAFFLFGAGALLVSAPRRSAPIFFVYGCLAAQLYLFFFLLPDSRQLFAQAAMGSSPPKPFDDWLLIGYWFAITLAAGLACRLSAVVRAPRVLEKTPAERCAKCGYLLYGLPEQRCPECGTPFWREPDVEPPEGWK